MASHSEKARRGAGQPPAAVVLAAAFLAAAAAEAKGDGFGVQGFRPAPGRGSFLTVEGAAVPPGVGGGLGGLLGYQHEPLVVHGCGQLDGEICAERTAEEIAIVEHHLSLELSGSLSLYRIFELGAALPMVLHQEGESGPAATGLEAPAGEVGLGDPRLHLKWDLMHTFGYGGELVGLALVPVISFPLGEASEGRSYLGDATVTVHPKLVFGLDFSRARLGLELGYLWREEHDFALAKVGQRLTYGAALEVPFRGRVSGIAELFGESGLSPDITESPLEGDLAVRVRSEGGLALTAGLGAGILAGVGAPAVRAFVGVGWERPVRE